LRQGEDITQDELFRVCMELKSMDAHNINFVTPTPYQELIEPVLRKLKREGFDLPIVWNCGGYETAEAVKRLEGLVDIYLPDFKYSENELAVKYSCAPGYFPNVVDVIKEMRRQISDLFDENNIMKQGLIIRHLILPGTVQNSIGVLDAINKAVGNKVFLSLMSQYYPVYKAFELEDMDRKLEPAEYEAVLKHLEKLGFENGFVQSLDSASEEYTPSFK
jgi:putative pyruvate formate lyase activating enzyme